MKQIITEDDIRRLEGRFIIQVNVDKPIYLNEIQKDYLPFFLEKRVNFIAIGRSNKVISCDLYGGTLERTRKQFVEHFNNVSEGKRFHRLLTQREMDVVNEFIKSRQY